MSGVSSLSQSSSELLPSNNPPEQVAPLAFSYSEEFAPEATVFPS